MKDVFISYSRRDQSTAQELCHLLESRGISCWIASRDIPPGREFDEAILDGIDESRIMVVILSPNANTSQFVKAEVNTAFSRKKSILTLRTEEVVPAKALELYLARLQWSDGFPPPLKQHVESLAKAIRHLLEPDVSREPDTVQDAVPPIPSITDRRDLLFLSDYLFNKLGRGKDYPWDWKIYHELTELLENLAPDPDSRYQLGLKELKVRPDSYWGMKMIATSGKKEAWDVLMEKLSVGIDEGSDHASKNMPVAERASELLEGIAGTDSELQYQIGLGGINSCWTDRIIWGIQMLAKSRYPGAIDPLRKLIKTYPKGGINQAARKALEELGVDDELKGKKTTD